MTLLAGLALAAALAAGQDAPQDRPPTTAQETPVEGILVEGSTLRERARAFVDTVVAPPTGRSLARWRDPVCVGVANLENEAAQYLVDRVSTVAADLGIRVGRPGCRANVLVVFSVDGAATAREMVERERRAFDVGGQWERGTRALREFQQGDAAVRWWLISVPTDPDTGERAARVRGDPSTDWTLNTGDPTAPVVRVTPSRIRRPTQDNLNKAIVVVDVDQLEGTTFAQLSDYVAMVTLAQIDPDAGTSGFDTILNLFDDPATAPGLTDWDWNYLRGLYRGAYGQGMGLRSQTGVVASLMARYEERDARGDTGDGD